ncbi:MAG: epoxyqueuosine reductase QueH [Lachnospiraceae bacterium]|nr:epoxyqueuosine reductase QueH [Lachnospiraceae bacterium]
MNQRNYQKELESLIKGFGENKPSLLLHSCCAPCSSYVFTYLPKYFAVTDYFYNPNITAPEEYEMRREEIKRLIREMPDTQSVKFVEAEYQPKEFFEAAKGLESCPEGGERCAACFRLRLRKSAAYAAEHHYEYVTTTLTISPLKNAALINRIGEEAASEFGVRWLPSDFKKKNGYRISTELSETYQLYRQNYCGCVFSKRQDLDAALMRSMK